MSKGLQREDPFGFVVIDKPAGLTSHACVNRLRQVFGIRRVGHGGTLDPAVTGVLPIALGSATRLLPYLPGAKTYRGTIQMGLQTNTDDLQGDVIQKTPLPELDQKTLEKALQSFRGTIEQRPPQVSAVHIEGERAYRRARRGEQMELPLRSITIHELRLLHWDPKRGKLELQVHCSAGTYIRSLARDLGAKLNCGGCLANLRRIQALGFEEQLAIPLPAKLQRTDEPKPNVHAPLTALDHLPRIEINTQEEALWSCGRQLTIKPERCQPAPDAARKTEQTADHAEQSSSKPPMVVIAETSRVLGIGTWESLEQLKPKVVFNAI